MNFKLVLRILLMLFKLTVLDSQDIDGDILKQNLNDQYVEKNHSTLVRQNKSILQNPCKSHGNCIVNEGVDVPVCYCDNECELFNDCCFDYPELSLTHKTLPDEIVCDAVQFGKARVRDTEFGSYLVSQCPSHFKNLNVSDECQGSLYPVSGKNGITYKNVYCAICHNVTDYKAWSFRFISKGPCDKNSLKALNTSNIISKIKYIVTQNCFRFFPPEGVFIRYCFLHQGNFEDDVIDRTLCESFSSPLEIKDAKTKQSWRYRNIFCKNSSLNESLHRCVTTTMLDTGYKKTWGMVSLVGMFNVRPPIEGLDGNKCYNGDIYHETYGACVDANCKDKSCEVEYIKNDEIIFETSFVTSDKVDINLVYRVLPLLLLTIQEDFAIVLSKGNLSCGQTKTMETECCIFNIRAVVDILGKKLLSEINKIISYMSEIEWSYIETESNKTLVVDNSQNRVGNCAVTEELLIDYRFDKQEMLRLHNIYANAVKNLLKTNFPESFKAEVKLLNNGTIELVKLGFQYRNESKMFNTGPISKWSYGTILTHIALSLSDVSLFLTLTLYKYLNLAQSLSGTISTHMMGVLLFAQLVFTFGDGAHGIPLLCLVLGIISHYLWLCAFTWISIFLAQVLKTMLKMHSNPVHIQRNEKEFTVIIAFGYSIPAIVVLPCALLDIMSVVHIGYADGICFPTAYPANLYSFTLPIVISLIINVIALITSSFLISNFNNSTHPILPIRNLSSFIPVYIRLSALCACPWFIGILADVLDSDVLRFIFIILAGSQGTIVSISFLSSKTIVSQIKRLLPIETKTELDTSQP